MTRNAFTLGDAAREFVRHPSPWMIGFALILSLAARCAAGDWQLTDALVPVAMLTAFPFFEWIVHVFVLHWKPRRFGRVTLDSVLARDHRLHHMDPRDVPLIFIPWRALLWILPAAVAVALLAFPRPALGLTFLSFLTVLGLCYEWCHYLIHSDYKPKTRAYRSIWRNHRQHHYKNEHYWFTVTTSGTADRALRTHPDPTAVPTSPTAKNLHAVTPARQ
ncbi:sterol desaturase family protein [Mycolicibacterium fortuitum]|uniref:Fatty acid hydroxylase-like protein n=2 Tax=Mycolicibacterium fortuitum TaxID=1766 RepID=A0A1A0RTJ9_MYCFO|nr:sterol desaturase family protein [Mycolicibacterium fortuitum]MCA4757026.1 sterol desaturase family protein [Mycolicibacterium fortuitum]MCV7139163.1 sterol desaturase family protein [Mycolicibacterium fortuitum]MDG5771916.1 sterol desaturase family protein [Mycolicibacterium fortuitum]MDG5784517.1 sterol desaturase family protein [Mycolicibacterium fortuitum]MDV7190794.1 sterol desaturase family protein [Mycolicibacterium fortuitum]